MQQPENPKPDTRPHAGQSLSATGRKLRTLAASAAIILILGFLAVHYIKSRHEDGLAQAAKETASAPPTVDVVAVEKAPPSISLTLPGATSAWYDSVIYGRVDGYVGGWSADIGDHVQKGQVLATIDTPDLDAQLVAAQAKLKAGDALVEFTRTTYDRWKGSPNGVVSAQERDAKKADYDSAVAQRGLEQADVDRYTALTAFKQVTAPYDGTITERHIDIGNLVTAGSTASTTPLYRIMQDDPMRVFVDVPQGAAQDIVPDRAAHITAGNGPGRIFEGKVTRTANAINDKTRTLRVEVDIPNSNHLLVPGMYVDVAFDVPSDGLLQVPAAALIIRSSGPQVAVIGKDGRVEFRDITIARDNGSIIEIASGVAAGEKVALNIGNQIAQGEAVNAQDTSDGGGNARK